MGSVCYCCWLFPPPPPSELVWRGNLALWHPLALPLFRSHLESRHSFCFLPGLRLCSSSTANKRPLPPAAGHSCIPCPSAWPSVSTHRTSRFGEALGWPVWSPGLSPNTSAPRVPAVAGTHGREEAGEAASRVSQPCFVRARRGSALPVCLMFSLCFSRSVYFLTCFLCPLVLMLLERAGCLAAGWLTRVSRPFSAALFIYATRLVCSEISTHALAHEKSQSPTKQNIEANALSSCQCSPSACLPNDFYFMPLWQSHPIRLKYPGLERLSPESFSKGASHRPLNPSHFMVQIFNSSERGSGGRDWGKQLQIEWLLLTPLGFLMRSASFYPAFSLIPATATEIRNEARKGSVKSSVFPWINFTSPSLALSFPPKKKPLPEKGNAIPFCQAGGYASPRCCWAAPLLPGLWWGSRRRRGGGCGHPRAPAAQFGSVRLGSAQSRPAAQPRGPAPRLPCCQPAAGTAPGPGGTCGFALPRPAGEVTPENACPGKRQQRR